MQSLVVRFSRQSIRYGKSDNGASLSFRTDIEGFANLAAALVEQYYGSSSAESSSQEAEQLLVSLSSALSKTQSTESPAVLSARYSA